MTLRARAALEAADVVIGHTTYIKLVRDLIPGKQVIAKGMTAELKRCREALQQAAAGHTVALVSSGDSGIYGMAGPTYEVLLQSGWRPNTDIQVEVIPGSTAAITCAALVGAPLTHDFCTISLSDLLTPWPVIAGRLEAAARADFVVALYNPKSARRRQQLLAAQRLLLRHRRPDTPVAIVTAAHREQQRIEYCTLGELANGEIGMLSTILVGNRSTFFREGLMITPRGYEHKYQPLTGEPRAGEKPGRSLSLGLAGWRTTLHRDLRDRPATSLAALARKLEVPLGDVLVAITEDGAPSAASGYRATPMGAPQLARVLDALRPWVGLRVVVASGAGVRAELRIRGDELQSMGDELIVIHQRFTLHLPWSDVAALWLITDGRTSHGAYCLDDRQEPLCEFWLTSDQPGSNGTAKLRFLKTRDRFLAAN